MPLRRQPYRRAPSPPRIRLTHRDKRILETIHAFDGLLSLRQIDRLFFSGMGRSQPRARMRALFDNGYVQMPDRGSIHKVPLGESVYWLSKNGAALVAGLQGQAIERFKWRRQPRFSQIEHDLRVNDFRMAVGEECRLHLDLKLETWVPESEFAMHPDKVSFTSPSGKLSERVVRPDGFFAVVRQFDSAPAKTFAFLLEIDMGSEDNPRFAREKVLPGTAYLKSAAYARRVGMCHGRYLVVTSGQRRMLNMKAQAERAGGNGLFYFATFVDFCNASILTDQVWLLAGHQEQRRLIP